MEEAFRFLLKNVSIDTVDQLPAISLPTYEDSFIQLNTTAFRLHVPHVADYFAENGAKVSILPCKNASKTDIELYLNGTVLGAILHQRQRLPLHASSFLYNGKGIVLCGDSGAGKSTLSYGIAQRAKVEFLTDDITPLLTDDKIGIQAISDRMKLWSSSLDYFSIENTGLQLVREDVDKYFVEMKEATGDTYPVDALIFLSVTENDEYSIREITGAEKFQAVLSNIYRKEFLDGLKAAKIAYFEQLMTLCSSTPFFSLQRPQNGDINETIQVVTAFLNQQFPD